MKTLLFKPALMVVMLMTLSLLVASQTQAQTILQRGTATSNTSTSTSITINKPTGVQVGDILIANIVQSDNDNGTLSNATRSGWTLIDGRLIYDAGAESWWGTVLYRIVDGTEGTNFAFTLDGDATEGNVGSIVAFSNVNVTGGVTATGAAGGPFDVDPGNINVAGSSSSTVTAPGLSTATANAGLVMIAQSSDNVTYSNWVASNPSTLSELDENDFNSTVDLSAGIAFGTRTTAGATGNATTTQTGSSRWGGLLIALKPMTISTNAISGSPFCVTPSTGAAVSVGFTSTGTFTGNTYTAQLSNGSGSFASPVNIGTLVSNANSGTISATIPANTATGTGYRIRVTSSGGPSVIAGTDNGTNLTINLGTASIAPSATQNININANGTLLTVTESAGATSREWFYGTVSGGPYGTSTGITSTTYTPNFSNNGTYYVVAVTTYPCGNVTSNQVQVNVSPTVATDAISGSPFCVTASAGSAVSVGFTSVGTFTGNTYTAQLSNSSGSFASPIAIGTLVSNANLGTINATIPANTATGSGYRIRVVSSGPAAIGTDNGSNLTVNLAANSIAPTGTQNINATVNGTALSVTEQSTAVSREWHYGTTSGGPYGTATGVTGTSYTPNFSSQGTYYIVCISTFSCGAVTSNQVQVNVSATVSTGSIGGSPFCVTASTSDAVSVPFTSAGSFTGNTYTAQLSNSGGSFASPVNIGTLVSDANSGTISANIPANTATGTGYRIRVISSSPAVTGSNNGSNLTVNLGANSIAPTGTQNINVNANGSTLTVTEQSTPTSRVWAYGTISGGPYSNNTASVGTTYQPNFNTQGTYYVVCVSTYPCGVVTSNQVQVNVTQTVTTGTIAGSPFCPGEAVSVPFTSAGTFTGNTYTAQLSNAAGSFASPTAIGTLVSDANAGTISATIPGAATGGSGYLIRVIASDPATTGSNSSAITISSAPTSVNATPGTSTICLGGNVPLTASATITSTTAVSSENFNTNGSFIYTAAGSNSGGGNAFLQRTSPGSIGLTSITNNDGSRFMLAGVAAFGSASTNSTLTSPVINTSSYSTLSLSFRHTYDRGSEAGVSVQVSTNGGTNWSNISTAGAVIGTNTFTSNQGANNNFVSVTIPLNSFVNNANFRIRFNYVANVNTSTAWWGIDDVVLSGTPSPLYAWTANTGSGVNGLPVNAETFLSSNSDITVTPTATTTYTLIAKDPVNSCNGTTVTTATVFVNNLDAGTIDADQTICYGADPAAFNSVADATGEGTITYRWESSTSPFTTWNAVGASANTYDAGALTQTTHYRRIAISSLNSVNCEAISNVIVVTVPTAQLNATVNSTPVTCNGLNDGTITISNPSGGFGTYEYTINGGTSWEATGNYTNLVPASYNVQIRDAAHTECVVVLNGSVLISEPAVISISSADVTSPVICNAGTGTVTIVATGGTGTLTYTFNAQSNNTGVFTGVAAGTNLPYSVTDANNCTAATGTITVTEPAAVPAPVSGGDQTVCEDGNPTQTLTATATSGVSIVWYDAASNGNVVPSPVQVGPGTVTYYAEAFDGTCTSHTRTAVTLTINVAPAAPVSGGNQTVCENGDPEQTLTATATGGTITWYDAATAGNVVASPVLTGVGTATYYAEASDGTCSSLTRTAVTLTINAAAAAPTSGGNQTVCEDGNPSQTLTATATGGTITWYDAATGGNVVGSPVQTGPGTVTYYAESSNGTCPSLTRTAVTLTINAAPAAPAASNQSVCYNGNPTHTITATATGGTITWYDAATGGNVVADPSQTGVGTSTYYAEAFDGNCTSLSRTAVTLKINLPPVTPAAILGNKNVCPYVGNASQVTYSIVPVQYAETYRWTLPPYVNLVSASPDSTSITVTFDDDFGTSNNTQIRVRSISSCGNSGQAILVLVSQFASTPSPIIAGTTDVCPYLNNNVPVTYSIRKVTAATAYIWSAPAGVNVTHPNGPGENDTTISVTFDNSFVTSSITVRSFNDCGTSSARSVTIFRNQPSTPGLISGPTNSCEYIAPTGSDALYTIRKMNGINSYNWTAPAGSVVTHQNAPGVNDTAIFVKFPAGFNNGAISVSATNNCGTSASPRNLAVGKLKPSTPSVIDVIQLQACPNRQYSYTLAALPNNAISVQWSVPAAAISFTGQGTTSIIVTYPATTVIGNVTATAHNNCGSSVTRISEVKLPVCPPEAPRGTVTANEVKTAMPVAGDKLDVNIFPNPSTSSFNLKVLTAGKDRIKVRILDIQGREFRTIVVLPYQQTSIGSDLKAGTYFVEITQGKHKSTQQIIKL